MSTCPKCVTTPSRINVMGSGSTLMGWTPHHDVTGAIHQHNPNSSKTHYRCSEQHDWVETTWPKCWCGWTADPNGGAGGWTASTTTLNAEQAERLGFHLETERRVRCACRHGIVDHPESGACGANHRSRHTRCECTKWEPKPPRVRWVSEWRDDWRDGGQ